LENAGCQLGLEFVGSATLRKGHKLEFVSSLSQTLDLIDALECPNVGLVLDCWQWYTQMIWAAQTPSATSRSMVSACEELDFSPHDATIALFTDEKVGCMSSPKSQYGHHRKEGRYEADEEVSAQLSVEVCWKCG